MDVIYFLIPLALVLLGLAIWAFFWAVGNDQFDDLDREANRILFDEDMKPRSPASGREAKPAGTNAPDSSGSRQD